MTIGEYETFYDKIKVHYVKKYQVHYVTIPFNLAKGAGLNKDDKVKVMIKKVIK
jgi:hypothetical protein